MRGRFVTLEGGEGTGKSTVLPGLARRIEGLGLLVRITREPGGSPLGERIRSLVVEPSDDPPCPVAELLLYAADRAHHVDRVIRPALEAGRVVLCDRYADATEAYQGWGRGLPLDQVRRLNDLATGGVWPQRTVVLDLDPREGLRRSWARHGGPGAAGEVRFEREALEFHRRVRQGYLEIARREPERVRVVDASGPPEQVLDRAWAAVADLFGG